MQEYLEKMIHSVIQRFCFILKCTWFSRRNLLIFNSYVKFAILLRRARGRKRAGAENKLTSLHGLVCLNLFPLYSLKWGLWRQLYIHPWRELKSLFQPVVNFDIMKLSCPHYDLSGSQVRLTVTTNAHWLWHSYILLVRVYQMEKRCS